jgi:hypothetical protein
VTAAIFALLGAFIGILGSFLVERLRIRASTQIEDRKIDANKQIEDLRIQAEIGRQQLAAFRDACAEFSAAIMLVRHLSLRIRDEGDSTKEIEGRLRGFYEEAWRIFVRIQLLSNRELTQREARLVIRHAWALWRYVTTGVDPRASEYPGTTPGARLTNGLRRFCVEARREMGVEHPESVAPEPEEWDLHPGVIRQGMSSS